MDTPSPLPPPPPDDPDDDLVAYLDGELDDDQTREVESKLALDPVVRARVESLKKTYDLLDYLPKSEPSPSFTSRTLTNLGISGNEVLPPRSSTSIRIAEMPKPGSRRWAVVLGWLGATILALVLGYAGHLIAQPHLDMVIPNKRASEQVRLLERMVLYVGVDDLEFARSLDRSDLFGDPYEVPHDRPPAASSTETFTSSELEKLEDYFKHLPLVRQEQLRRLDEEIQALDSTTRVHVLSVLERYAIWLDRLPDAYRKEVLAERSAADRLETIDRVRRRQWRDSLPVAIREKLKTVDTEERDRILADRLKSEQGRRQLWEAVRRRWSQLESLERPWPFDSPTLTTEVQEFVEKVLRPRLRPFEASELDALKSDATANSGWYPWWMYGYAVLRASESHPGLPMAAEGKPMVMSVDDLGKRDQKLLNELARLMKPVFPKSGSKKLAMSLKDHPTHGRWPDFAEFILSEAKQAGLPLKFPLGPSQMDQYSPGIRSFLTDQLFKKISAKERDELAKLEGQWPEHSRKLVELSHRYDLSMPGVMLPGSPNQWTATYLDSRRGKR